MQYVRPLLDSEHEKQCIFGRITVIWFQGQDPLFLLLIHKHISHLSVGAEIASQVLYAPLVSLPTGGIVILWSHRWAHQSSTTFNKSIS